MTHGAKKARKRAAKEEKERLLFEEELRCDLQSDSAYSVTDRFNTLVRIYRWLTSRLEAGSTLSGWDKNALTETFGAEVWQRVETTFRHFWREQPPILWSAKPPEEKNHVYWGNQIGSISVKTEALTSGWATALKPDDARTAVAYATLELNVFPPYLTAIATAHPKETGDVICGELSAELSVAGHHDFLPTLERLTHADRSIRQLCIPRLFEELQSWPDEYVGETGSRRVRHLDSVLHILGDAVTEEYRGKTAQICVNRYRNDPTGPSAFVWLRGIFRVDTRQGADALIQQLTTADRSTVGEYAISAFSALLDRDRTLLFEIEDPRIRAGTLGKLIRLVYKYVRPEDDVVHQGVYSPGRRDNAEVVRQYLFEMLLGTSGAVPHRVLMELAEDEVFADWADRLRMRARQRAADNAEFAPYRPEDVRILETRYEAPPSDRDGLFAMILDRLGDLADDLAHGDFSDRATVRKIEEESEMQTDAGRTTERPGKWCLFGNA